jgi:Domain of unknown function (DUF6398)
MFNQREYQREYQRDYDDLQLAQLAYEVGGQDVLDHLDDRPLPDEPFDWTGIEEDVASCVQEVLAHIDRCCDGVLDAEYRTACRRLLARAAVGDSRVFRRKAKPETAAAAIVWIVGSANNTFDGPRRLMLASRVTRFLGVKGSASSRARTFLVAAGFSRHYYLDCHLDATYLVSARRREIIEKRERYSQPSSAPCPQCPYVRDSDPGNVTWLR